MRTVFILVSCILFLSVFSDSYSQEKYAGPSKSAGPNVNSPYDEQDPVLSPDGKVLYFTRSKDPGNIGGKRDTGDIWYTEKDSSGNWLPAKNAGSPWNSREYNAIIGFFNNGKGVYLCGHYDPSGSVPATHGISVSYYSGGRWTFPVPVEIKYYTQYTEFQNASLSADGQIIVFSLSSYDSRGAEDIYVSFRRHDGSWTDIQDLGPVINTPMEEMSPYLAPDNKTLFFASNGHGGLGSFDLFMARRLDDTWRNWTQPENLGDLINSNGRELYYFLDAKHNMAYFCSTQNSDGYGDIRYISIAPNDSLVNQMAATAVSRDTLTEFKADSNQYFLTGKVLSSKDHLPVEGVINIYLANNAPLGEVKTNPATGSFSLQIASNKDFLIKISAKGFMNLEEKLSTAMFPDRHLARDYYLEPLDEGRVFKLENVLFRQSTAELLDSSYTELNLVYDMLKENPDINIDLSGYTDNQGDPRLNLILSEKRVRAVMDYLIRKGIDPSRMTGKGYGSAHPIASNATEATRRLNRRVEFKIVRK